MAVKQKDSQGDVQEQPSEFDPKWLKGLTLRAAEAEKFKDESGREQIRHKPTERPLTQDDLLDWKISGKEVILVTKDGRKHHVAA
ncbi:MAG: hypothetical protein M0036_04980 [Desulfobacteraceae bacterium]|nr:hypothetical protein [Desulfobacteraceae bacterium]